LLGLAGDINYLNYLFIFYIYISIDKMSYTLPYGMAELGGAILGGAIHRKKHHVGHHVKHHVAHHLTAAAMLGGKKAVKAEMKAVAKHESKEQLARKLPEKEVLKLVPKDKLEKKVVAAAMKKIKKI
jgi:hypothetical protein